MTEPRLSIVVPTLNEEGNIGELVRRLEATLAGIDHETIVVDDDSTDRTRAEAKAAGGVRVLHRREAEGLSSAVLDGLRVAEGEFVCVMDGDLQHPPEAVLDLLAQAHDEGVDLVVGSRYVTMGEVRGFPPSRRAVSQGARVLAHAASPTVRARGLEDPTSGFFLVRRSVLELDAIEPRGYKILLDVLHACPIREVREVGITFRGRSGGQSKMTLATAVAYLHQLASFAFRAPANRRFAKFGLVGATGVVVNLGLLAALTEILGVHYLLSAAVALEVSILSNFTFNDLWTFRDRRPGRWWNRLGRFNTISLGALFVNLLVLALLVEVLAMHYLAAELVAIGVSFLANYAGNISWTYVTSEDPATLPWLS